METVFNTAKEKMTKTLSVLKSDFNAIRAGRANAAVLDKIYVDYYGSPMPINQLATITLVGQGYLPFSLGFQRAVFNRKGYSVL